MYTRPLVLQATVVKPLQPYSASILEYEILVHPTERGLSNDQLDA